MGVGGGAPPAYTSELPGQMFGAGTVERVSAWPEQGMYGRHELSSGRYSEMPGVEVFRGHELGAK